MTKRKSSRKKSTASSKIITVVSYLLAGLIFLVAAAGTGYYLGYGDGRDDAAKGFDKERQASKKLIERLQKIGSAAQVPPAPELAKRLQSVLQRDKDKYADTALHEYSDAAQGVSRPPVGPSRAVKLSAELPKLAIIIDDVAFAADVRNIKALQIPLTMSFLPPSRRHPDSAKLAAREPYYMVHLPLEAKNFNAEEPFTLRVRDSQQEIMQRISDIKSLFPKVRFLNNHTGSTFTSNEIAMNRLVFALRRDGIEFIDSRTTADTKVPLVMKSYGLPYVARDVFLDHHPDVKSVKKQIKAAVEIAKKHGTAIAIGHPHKETLEALRQSKDILQDVQLVRIGELI